MPALSIPLPLAAYASLALCCAMRSCCGVTPCALAYRSSVSACCCSRRRARSGSAARNASIALPPYRSTSAISDSRCAEAVCARIRSVMGAACSYRASNPGWSSDPNNAMFWRVSSFWTYSGENSRSASIKRRWNSGSVIPCPVSQSLPNRNSPIDLLGSIGSGIRGALLFPPMILQYFHK